ncbi:hypothetical protein [Novipirellula artificiosorum]|uniref:hypothetical protein n=1 Tax=Novipirellula artificiosorum TaxID=2528016 RepID=UPI0011B55129|nr:hypothetical protein [Novipirellula artificiosorum]
MARHQYLEIWQSFEASKIVNFDRKLHSGRRDLVVADDLPFVNAISATPRSSMFRDQFQSSADRAAAEDLSHIQDLAELTELECQARHESRIKRLMTSVVVHCP